MRAALESHNRAFAAIGGMAAHYGTAVLPARPYKPRDKAVLRARTGR